MQIYLPLPSHYVFCTKNYFLPKKSEVKSEILNQSPKLISFLLFNYSMLTIRIVEYYSEVENSTNTNIEYHYSVPTIRSQLFKYWNSSNNS